MRKYKKVTIELSVSQWKIINSAAKMLGKTKDDIINVIMAVEIAEREQYENKKNKK